MNKRPPYPTLERTVVRDPARRKAAPSDLSGTFGDLSRNSERRNSNFRPGFYMLCCVNGPMEFFNGAHIRGTGIRRMLHGVIEQRFLDVTSSSPWSNARPCGCPSGLPLRSLGEPDGALGPIIPRSSRGYVAVIPFREQDRLAHAQEKT